MVLSRCIYCLDEQKAEAFNREHVLPQAFGRFTGENPVLTCVCERCNRALGRDVDEILATDSVAAFDRARLGVRPFRSKGQRSRMHAIFAGGALDGARGRLVPHSSSGGVALEPAPQIGLTPKGGTRRWFDVLDLPPRAALVAAGCTEVYVEVLGPLEAARQALQAKGYGPLGEFIETRTAASHADGNLVSPVTDEHLRAAAKIAFGYLAAVTTAGFALVPAFDVARRFVRHGVAPRSPIVSVHPNTFVRDAHPMHYVALEVRGGHVVGWVSLFMRVRFIVQLGRIALPSFLASTHVFDLRRRTARRVRCEARV